MAETPSIKQQHLENLLGEELGEWLQRRRAEGTRWRDIETALHQRTGVEVTAVTLRAWYPDLIGSGKNTDGDGPAA